MIAFGERNLEPLFLFWRCNIAKRKGHLINEDIRFSQVRLIDADGEMVGVVPLGRALEQAEESELDLVLISANPQNPVCRIMDYGKYAFEQKKREREARKKQKVTEIKEVQIKLTTEEHDTQVKVKNALRFLGNGDRVKVVIRFRGREMAYTNQGYAVMENFAAKVGDAGTVDRRPLIEGRHMVMYLSPNKDNKK